MSEQLSEAQIHEQLSATRKELTDTISELVTQVDPRHAVKRTKAQAQAAADNFAGQAKNKVNNLQEQAKRTINNAKEGDTTAMGIVAGVATVALGVGALVLKRLIK